MKTGQHYTFKGITDTLPGWAKRMGLKRGTLQERVHYQRWPIGVALMHEILSSGAFHHRRLVMRRMIEGFNASNRGAVQ